MITIFKHWAYLVYTCHVHVTLWSRHVHVTFPKPYIDHVTFPKPNIETKYHVSETKYCTVT